MTNLKLLMIIVAIIVGWVGMMPALWWMYEAGRQKLEYCGTDRLPFVIAVLWTLLVILICLAMFYHLGKLI